MQRKVPPGSLEVNRVQASQETESGVEDALRMLLDSRQAVSVRAVKDLLKSGQKVPPTHEVEVSEVNLSNYDALLCEAEVA